MCILNLFEENQYAQASRALFIDTRMKKLRTVPGKKPRKAHTISITEGSITGRTPIYILLEISIVLKILEIQGRVKPCLTQEGHSTYGGRRNSPKPAWRRATPA